MKGKTILLTSILTMLVLAFAVGAASACSGIPVNHPEQYIAEKLCSINFSLRLISYAAIAFVLIKLVELVALFKKNK